MYFIMSNILSERNWELLLEAIDNRRVVPIIGDEFFYIIENGQEISVNDFLIGKLSEKFNAKGEYIDFSSISDAIELENFINYKIRYINAQTDIYYEISNLLATQKIHVRDSLKQLLRLNSFPLILTTSFIPKLDILLSNEGCEYVSMAYEKSADSDIKPTMIHGEKPVIYHLFGSCSKIKKSFMVTEEDLLEYMHLWHEPDARPPFLTKYLSNKFLMVLGCNYPNWLFRFFWHSIRNFSLMPQPDHNSEIMEVMQAIVSIDKTKEDADLERFLARIHTSVYKCSESFIDELTSHWNEAYGNKHLTPGDAILPESQNSKDTGSIDVFISYASEDREAASQIANMLKELGGNVWFDDHELVLSEKYEAEITTAISKAKRFMPIISNTTMKEEARYFRREWAIAHKVLDDRFGLPFFAPITIDDCDPKDERIPKTFRDCHIESFQSEDIKLKLKKFIRSIR